MRREAQQVRNRGPEPAGRPPHAWVRLLRRRVLGRAGLDLVVASRRLLRFEARQPEPERVEHAGAHRLLEARAQGPRDRSRDEPEAGVAVRKELARPDRQQLRLALRQPQKRVVRVAEPVERLRPLARESALVAEQLPDGRVELRSRRPLVERQEPVLDERHRQRCRERLRDRRDLEDGVRRDGLGTAELAEPVSRAHCLAVSPYSQRDPGHVPALPRLCGPVRQPFRRKPLHRAAATLLRARSPGRARSLARRAETAETHI